MFINLSNSVDPPFLVTISHLRLQESPKDSLACPPHPISLLNSALDDCLRVRDDMHVYPDALAQHHVKFLICITILLVL